MGVFEAISKGFSYAAKGIGLILILFVFNLVVSLASIIILGPTAVAPTPGAIVPPISFGKGVAALMVGIISILASIFIHGGSLGTIRDLIKEGKFNLSNFTNYGGSFYGKLLGLGALITAILLAAVLLIVFIVSAAAALNNVVITAIFIILAIALGLVALGVLVLFIFAPYAIVVDGAKVIDAVKKSSTFAKKNIASILGLGLIAILISIGIGLISGLFAVILNLAFRNAPKISETIQAIINSGLNSYITVVLVAAFMVYYLGKSKPAFTPGPASPATPAA